MLKLLGNIPINEMSQQLFLTLTLCNGMMADFFITNITTFTCFIQETQKMQHMQTWT